MSPRLSEFLRTPPKKRVAAALHGFGFGRTPSLVQHLRGFGADPVEAPAQAITMTVPVVSSSPTIAVAPSLKTTAPVVMSSPTMSVTPSLKTTAPVVAASPTLSTATEQRKMADLTAQALAVEQKALADQAHRLAVQEELRRRQNAATQSQPAPESEGGGGGEQILETGAGSNREQPSDPGYGTQYADGRSETEYIAPSDTEDAGGSRDSTGTSIDEAKAVETKPDAGGVALAQSQSAGGFMATITALPLPVKIAGGVAVVYILWRVLK